MLTTYPDNIRFSARDGNKSAQSAAPGGRLRRYPGLPRTSLSVNGKISTTFNMCIFEFCSCTPPTPLAEAERDTLIRSRPAFHPNRYDKREQYREEIEVEVTQQMSETRVCARHGRTAGALRAIIPCLLPASLSHVNSCTISLAGNVIALASLLQAPSKLRSQQERSRSPFIFTFLSCTLP